jgi:phosphoserine aminotransferase
MARIHNFCAGPAALPVEVLERAQSEILDFQGSGMSIMEMSHRGKVYDAVIKAAEANVRKLMDLSDDFAVLFLPGGASQQFAQIPMNFLPKDKAADHVHTGAWAQKAIKEAKLAGAVNVIWDGKADNYMRAPRPDELKWNDGAAYAHICSNETIGGIRFTTLPKTKAPLVADMSSEIMSRVIDAKSFSMIYAGAQKNLGPSGLALVVLRKDWAETCPDTVPIFLRYKTHIPEPSLYNTPNTWAVYILKLVTDWMLAKGGIAAFEKTNEAKAKTLYDVLDASPFWKPCAAKDSRSIMNVTWRLATEELEAAFVKQAQAAGLDQLKGHRSVGGLRASIYNACPEASVKALAQFMRDFEKKNG